MQQWSSTSAAELVRDDISPCSRFTGVNALERYDDAMVIEEAHRRVQERQDELLKEQAATEVAEPEETLEEPAEAEAESTPKITLRRVVVTITRFLNAEGSTDDIDYKQGTNDIALAKLNFGMSWRADQTGLFCLWVPGAANAYF